MNQMGRRLALLLATTGAFVLLLSAQAPQGRAGQERQAGGKGPAKPRILYEFSEKMQVGFSLLDAKDKPLPITYPDGFTHRAVGETSITVLRMDGKDYALGFQGADPKVKKEPLGKDRLGHATVWILDQVQVTQSVEIVPSMSGALDACVVRYQVENLDKKPRAVGVRVLVDTYMVDNDGHPFAVPGKNEKEMLLVTQMADYRNKEVPDYVQALQHPDLAKPGWVVYYTVRPGGGLPAPDRLSLTHWPEDKKNLYGWEVPIKNMRGGKEPDASLVLYWDPAELAAGGQRTVGFALGAGRVTLGKGKE